MSHELRRAVLASWEAMAKTSPTPAVLAGGALHAAAGHVTTAKQILLDAIVRLKDVEDEDAEQARRAG